jgi:hypothetical protein
MLSLGAALAAMQMHGAGTARAVIVVSRSRIDASMRQCINALNTRPAMMPAKLHGQSIRLSLSK